MSIKVKALANATEPKRASYGLIASPVESDNWQAGDIDYVDDELRAIYEAQPTIFEILSEVNTTLTTGVAAVSGLSAKVYGDGVLNQIVFTLDNVAQTVTNGTEYQSTKLFDFPAGRILVLGVTANLQQKTTSALASTLNASSTGAIALGTAAASSTTLATTMADLLPSTAFTSSATVNVAGTAVGAALAASAQFDGATTAIDMYLNTAYATTTDVDGNATQTISGTITLTYILLGDY